MFVANPTDPSFPVIRYTSTLGLASPYPRDGHPSYGRSTNRSRRSQRGQLSAIAGVVLAAAAFGAGFLGGFSAAGPTAAAPVAQGPVRGEFRLAPGNLMPPGYVVAIR